VNDEPHRFGPRPWRQRHWDWRAAANFMLGGAGAGLYVAAVVAEEHRVEAQLLALALVAAGLGAVWLEIGRKLRALHVFFNPFTSWMTRESFAALLLFALAFTGIGFNVTAIQQFAAIAALAFIWCQARILRASKGIPAWRAPQGMPLIVFTDLAEGAGLGLCFSADDALLMLFALAVVARAMAWSHYRAAAKAAALEAAGAMLFWIGTVVALALALAAYFVSEFAFAAGLAALAAGARLKFDLVTRASFNQGFSLQHLPTR